MMSNKRDRSMQDGNIATLETANAAITVGDFEGFLVHCTEDTQWHFVGERTLQGKAAVRAWMAETYQEPPRFQVQRMIPGCMTRDDAPTPLIAETQVLRQGRCEELYPSNPAPREVAGAGIASDIIKCQLQPVDEGDYPVPLTPQQRDRLHRIFAEGVCDWSRPGIEQRGLAGTWLTF